MLRNLGGAIPIAVVAVLALRCGREDPAPDDGSPDVPDAATTEVSDADGDTGGGDDEADGDAPADLAGDAWVPACGPDDFPGVHEPAFDTACQGNAGCTRRTCEACTSSCVLCDGPRCVGVVADDSCLTPPPGLGEFGGEPAGAVPGEAGNVRLALGSLPDGRMKLVLTDAGTAPAVAKWVDVGGVTREQALVGPVVLLAERVLVAGEWTRTNFCTGQVLSDTEGPRLEPVVAGAGEEPAHAVLPLEPGEPWQARVAWIRVHEDGDGLRVAQWFEPATALVHSFGATVEVAATAVEAFPLEEARPLGASWGAFDWAAALGDL